MKSIRNWLDKPLTTHSRIILGVASMVVLYAGLLFSQWIAPHLAAALAAGGI